MENPECVARTTATRSEVEKWSRSRGRLLVPALSTPKKRIRSSPMREFRSRQRQARVQLKLHDPATRVFSRQGTSTTSLPGGHIVRRERRKKRPCCRSLPRATSEENGLERSSSECASESTVRLRSLLSQTLSRPRKRSKVLTRNCYRWSSFSVSPVNVGFSILPR